MNMHPRWHRYALVLLATSVGFAASAKPPSTSVSRIERQAAVGAAPPAATTRAVTASSEGVAQKGTSDLSLAITVTPFTGDPDACGAGTHVEVRIGDQVNICYTLTNLGAVPLTHHTLTDSLDGDLLAFEAITVPPGQSHAFVRTIVATADTTRSAQLTSYSTLPHYDANDEAAPAFVDISTTGTDIGFVPNNSDDNEFTAVQAGFPLRLYGAESSDLCVSIDGFIGFDDAECLSPSPGSQPPPGYSFNADIPTNVGNGINVPAYLAPFWTNLDDGPGRVYVQTRGTAPDREFVIQWDSLEHYMLSTSAVTFQVVFEENDGTIRYEYRNTLFGNDGDNGGVGTVGLQGDPRGLFEKYSFYQPALTPNSAIVWTYTPSVDTSATGNEVSISAGDPVLAVAQPSVAGLAVSGSQVDATLTVRNDGNRDLTWGLSEAPGASRQHLPRVSRHVSRPSTAQPRADDARHAAPVARGLGAGVASNGVTRGAFNVPTFAVSYLRPGLVNFDALDPTGTYTPINASTDWIYAASFLDNDFTKLWVIVLDSWDHMPGTYGTVDVNTGVFTVVGRITGAPWPNWSGLTQDPLTGMVYASNFSYNPFSAEGALYTIDLETGEARRIGPIDGPGVHPVRYFPGLAVSPDGRMYGLDLYGQSLVAIDKTTGAASVIESLGLDVRYGQDIEFDQSTGDLYWASLYGTGGQTLVTEMRVIDPLTALSQPIAPLPPGGSETFDQFTALAIARPGVGCVAPGDVPWLSFEGTTAGVLLPGTSQDVSVVLDAEGLAAGTYEATICVFGDDPRRQAVPVTVTLAVTDAPPVVDQVPSDLSLMLFNNEIVAPEGTSGLTAESADDFVVTGYGWTVSAFAFSVAGNGANPVPAKVNVHVFADEGGAPGAQAVCGVDAQTAVSLAAEQRVVVSLSEPCALAAGTYWVVWSFADIDISTGRYGFAVAVPEQHGAAGMWRNPAGSLGFGCTSWSPFASCGTLVAPAARDLAFSVYATPVAPPACNSIMADDFEDTPAPAPCSSR